MIRKRIFTLNEPNVRRIDSGLAVEIGLNESIVLLQIEYWISISNHIIDGVPWTYQSIREMQKKIFPFWSISTIQRTIKNLLSKGYIIEGNFNQNPYDKTRWFTINFERVSQLKSIKVMGYETPIGQNETPLISVSTQSQNETPSSQNETPIGQNETTIPENTTKNTSEEESVSQSIIDNTILDSIEENNGNSDRRTDGQTDDPLDVIASLMEKYGLSEEDMEICLAKLEGREIRNPIGFLQAVVKNYIQEKKIIESSRASPSDGSFRTREGGFVPPRNHFNSYGQRKYDVKKLEQRLLKRSYGEEDDP